MKVHAPDGGTIVLGGILDGANGPLGILLAIVQILIGLLLPAIQTAQ